MLEQKRDFLFSIRPEYAHLIVEGEKTVELRRRFTLNATAGALALIYCTSPTQAIIGFARIKKVELLPVDTLWSKHGKRARINEADFDSYFLGRDDGYAILFDKAVRFEKQIAASKLRKKFGFVAPQSFVYLTPEYYSLLEHDQLQTTH